MDIKGEDRKVITQTQDGFTGRRMFSLMLSENYQSPLLAKPTKAEADTLDPMVLISRTLVRGQCKTHGFHESSINIRPTLKRALAHPEDKLAAREIADAMDKQFFTVKRMITHALRVFAAQGNVEKPNSTETPRLRDHPANDKVLAQFEGLADHTFWDALQDELEAAPGNQQQARDHWLQNGTDGLLDHARTALAQAVETLPASAILRRRAQQEAIDLLDTRLRAKSGFPWLFPQPEPGQPAKKAKSQQPPQATQPDPQQEADQPKQPSDMVANIAGYVSQLAAHRRGDLAALRRLDPDRPDSQTFHNIVERYQLDTSTPDGERRWAWIVKNIAANTPPPSARPPHRTAHNPRLPLGRALHSAGEPARTSSFLSDNRFNSMISTKGSQLLQGMEQAIALLGKHSIAIDWRQVARLVLAQNTDPAATSKELDQITADYYRAVRRSRNNRATAAA